jgi:hypothetical protein
MTPWVQALGRASEGLSLADSAFELADLNAQAMQDQLETLQEYAHEGFLRASAAARFAFAMIDFPRIR